MDENASVQNQLGETASARRPSIKRRGWARVWNWRNWRGEERDQRAEKNMIRDELGSRSYRRPQILAARQISTTILVLGLSRPLLRVHRTTGRHAAVLDGDLFEERRSEHAVIARGEPCEN